MKGFAHTLMAAGFLAALLSSPTELSAQAPEPPTNVTLSYDYATHLATLRWTAPVRATDSTALDASQVTYSVRRTGQSAAVVTGYPGTTYREDLTVGDLAPTSVLFGQGLARYVVTATCNGATSAGAYSTFKVIGEPVTLPYAESFAGGEMHSFWSEDHDGRGRWGTLAASNVYVQDGDGGMLCYTSNTADESSLGYSGLISLGDATAPTLSFHYFYTGMSDQDSLQLLVCRDGGVWEKVRDLDVQSADHMEQWQHVVVPLSDYADSHFIQIGFHQRCHEEGCIVYVDNIRIYDQVGHDLALSEAALPPNVRPDEARTVSVRVTNNGLQPADGYEVSVYADGQRCGTARATEPLPSQASTVVTLSVTPSVAIEADSVSMAIVVVSDSDEVASNDTIAPQRVRMLMPSWPRPRNVAATPAGGGATVSWQAPAAPRTAGTAVTDGFETAPDFTISNFGDWVLIDNNGTWVYGISDIEIPHTGEPQAFTVINADSCGLNDTWAAHGGVKYLAAFSTPGGPLDHWLLSPRLSEEAQTVTFWARAYSGSYRESFEVYFSDTDISEASFKQLGAVTTAAGDNQWHAYSYDLPSGTRYFAVRATSDDQFALLLDDFTFIPDTTGRQDITLLGYNVYRDGERVNAAPVTTLAFTDGPHAGSAAYRVSAVYDKGESGLSDAAVADGIATVAQPATASDGAWYDLQGRRVVRPSLRGVYIHGGKKALK